MTDSSGKKIKVLFIARWYPDRKDPQLGVFIKKHAQAAALFSDVSLLYISPFDPALQVTDFYISSEQGVLQLFIYYRKSRLKLITLLRMYFAYRRGWRSVLKNAGRPDLIHAHVLLKPGLMAYLLAKQHGLKYLITEHWTGYVNNLFHEKPVIYRWLSHYVSRHASALTVVSESLKAAMIRSGFTDNITVIPNVVDQPEKIKTGAATEKIRMLTVADLLDSQKNISATIRAVTRISRKRKDMEFHIVGGGPDEDLLKRLATESGVKDTFVFFHGRKNNEEVYEFLNDASFVIVNSNVETFSVVTAEALSCGKPVVATRSGGPEEILTERTGMLIEKGKDEQLENAILRMMDQYKQYDANELRVSVAERFSRKRAGESFYRIYRQMVSRQETAIA